MNGRVDDQGMGTVLDVRLSRSNLENLLRKLDDPTSHRRIERVIAPGVLLVVTAEDDVTHYNDADLRQPESLGMRGRAVHLGDMADVPVPE